MFDGNQSLRRHTWNLGEQIEIKVESALYEGTFNCQIIGINLRQGIIHTSFPKSQGKLVLLPVGTVVWVGRTSNDYGSERYTVIDRTSGENRCLVLQLIDCKGNNFINFTPQHEMKMLTVSSGKGGVGKTTFVINLAFALAAQGKTVCILDAALGNANVDILLDVTPRYNLAHVIAGQCRLMEILVEVSSGVYILPGCSGLQRLTEMTDYEYNYLAEELNAISEFFDVLLIDTMAGISRNVTNFIMASQGGCLVTTAEPHAVTDTYALLKVLVRQANRPLNLSLVVNRVELKIEAEDVAEKLQFAAKKFLDFELKYGGFIVEDYRVRQANMQQKPVIEFEPTAFVSGCFRNIGEKIFSTRSEEGENEGSFERIIAKIKDIKHKA